MLTLLIRRVRTQWPLLAALVALLAIGATVAGACALLVTRTAEQALESVATRGPAADVETTAYTVGVVPKQGASVAADARTMLTESYAPFRVTTTARASSRTRELPSARLVNGLRAETYLSGMDGLRDRTTLLSGRWPAAGRKPVEALLLDTTARLLGIRVGQRVEIGTERAFDAAPPMTVRVVGIVRPRAATGWDRDPLNGRGYFQGFSTDDAPDQAVPTYGPFLMELTDLYATGSTLDRLQVVGDPHLAGADLPDLDRAADQLAVADRRLARALGDRVRIERVDAQLPRTMAQAREQRRVASAVVLAVAVLGCGLTAAALVLAGRLTSSVRADENTLLSALGVSPRQFAAAGAVETAALALLAAAVAAPASALLHAGLTRIPPLSGAGLTVAPGTNAAHLLSVAGSAVGLALLLAVLTIRPVVASGERRHRVELLARSGADVLLVAVAAIGWWQLSGQPDAASTRTDVVRVAAPALMLLAGAAITLRVVPPVLSGLDRLGRRARSLVLPLAAFEAARRSHAVAAGLLVSLACAAATFGVAFDATWQRSQAEQADLQVGTDLTAGVTGVPTARDAAAIGAATGGSVSPAAHRGVSIGQWVGVSDPPRLVAVDTRRAGRLLRGRIDRGRTWAQVGAVLAAPAAVPGFPVAPRAALRISGTATGSLPIAVAPRLVMQDPTGLRTTCIGDRILLDGTAHRLPDCAGGAEGQRLVAVALPFTAAEPAPDKALADVRVVLSVPGAAGKKWTAVSTPPTPQLLGDPAAEVGKGRITMSAQVQFSGLNTGARTLVAAAFAAPGTVPIAVAERVADRLRLAPGTTLTIPVNTTPVQVKIAAIVPEVPGAPGEPAILADIDVLSRSLILGGDLAFPVDAWWVGEPAKSGAAAGTAALHLGEVTTRAGETARLSGSPPRAGVRPALVLLVLVAALLLLAGVVLHVNSDLRVRAVEVARLRGLGITRRQVRGMLAGQHAGVLLALMTAGVAVGGLATVLVAPAMIRAETGAAPVPPPNPVWPWATEGILLAVLLIACALAVAVVVITQTRRADAAHLRVAT